MPNRALWSFLALWKAVFHPTVTSLLALTENNCPLKKHGLNLLYMSNARGQLCKGTAKTGLNISISFWTFHKALSNCVLKSNMPIHFYETYFEHMLHILTWLVWNVPSSSSVCSLFSSCFFHVCSWIPLFVVTTPQPYIQLFFLFTFFCIHCLSISIANNSKWVFFIHRTLERRVKRRGKRHVSKLEAYARRQRDGKTLTDHQGNRRENCEGRIESRANYVLWTCLSDCLESSGKL